MAIILYKKGNTTKVRGIPCQMQTFEPDSFRHLLKKGWYKTPEECYAEPEPELVEEVVFKSDLEIVLEEEDPDPDEEPEFDINNLYEDPENAE